MSPGPLASLPTRQGRAEIRHGLQHGTLALADVLNDPPACVAGLTIAEVLRWCRGVERTTIWQLNKRAVFDGINLLAQIGRAPARTRRWVIEHEPSPHGRGASRLALGFDDGQER